MAFVLFPVYLDGMKWMASHAFSLQSYEKAVILSHIM